MVTLIKYGALSGGEKYNVNALSLDGLSTDTKPTRTYIEYGSDGREVGRMGIPNGSLYTEIDTGDTYMYDADNITWHKVSIGGGGGGTQGGIVLVGETTTQLVDNATTNPITVDGQSYTAQPNDAVIYGNKEFLFDGTKWHEFGDLSGLSSKDIGAMTNYVKAQTGAAIAATDTLNQAIGKVEKRVEVNENNISSNKNEIDYVGSTITNTRRNGGSALYDDITALDVLIPLTFEMTGTQYESLTIAVADDSNLTNVEYYENVNPASTLYIKPHYPTTYIRCMDVSGVYINGTYPVDINKIISGLINRQSTYIGLGKNKPNCALSVAVGYKSESNCTGEKNTTVGVENLIDTTGVRNTSIGYHALFRCTSGTDNASIGAESGDDTTAGTQNTALGAYSLQRNAIGNNNTAVGFQALKGGQSSFTSNAEFNGNTVVGVRSMKNMTAGDYNTAIGFQSLTSSSNRSGCIAVGANADCTKDNQMVLGSSSITEVVFCGDKKINFNNDGTVTWEQIT